MSTRTLAIVLAVAIALLVAVKLLFGARWRWGAPDRRQYRPATGVAWERGAGLTGWLGRIPAAPKSPGGPRLPPFDWEPLFLSSFRLLPCPFAPNLWDAGVLSDVR
jgi:hypothetical protein